MQYSLFFFIFIGVSLFGFLIAKFAGVNTYFSISIITFILGMITYIMSMFMYKKVRFIRDTATSKTGSLPIGFVEVYGKALGMPKGATIYRYIRMKELGADQGRGKKIVTPVSIDRDELTVNPFLIDDGSGAVYVNPENAELLIDTKSWSDGHYYYEEAEIKEGDYVYCLGTAVTDKDLDLPEEIARALKEAKKDKYFYAKYDTDGDGKISQGEWDAARKKITQSVVEGKINVNRKEFVEITKGAENKIFIISNKSEKELTQSLFTKTLTMLFSGIFLIAFSVFDAFVRLSVFSKSFCASYLSLFDKAGYFTYLIIIIIAILFFVIFSIFSAKNTLGDYKKICKRDLWFLE